MPRTWRSSAPREIGDRGRQEEIMSGDQRCQGTIFYVYVDKYCYFFASTELQDSTLGILRSGPTGVQITFSSALISDWSSIQNTQQQ